ncbi:MAG: hypothetical protein ABSG57_02005 [Candidatus Bathyarchaeia archaeon]|jgi:hypothetical protein
MSKRNYEVGKFIIVMITIAYLQIKLNFLRVGVRVFPNSQALLKNLQSTRDRLGSL